MNADTADVIRAGQAILGIEFGSTRIKAILIDLDNQPIASGEYAWENRLEGGFWTYSEEEIWKGLAGCYKSLKEQVREQYGVTLTRLAAIGFSAMMHGYLAFDGEGKLLVPFRTWRNTTTGDAARELSDLFEFNIPERWSIAHLFQAIEDRERHVPEIRYLTTLAGYVHWLVSGEKVLGIGDASGMFPVDSATKTYDAERMRQFDLRIADGRFPWLLKEILPRVLPAGADAGTLTEEGARMIDPEGDLESGIALCPPEGDAGTGMAATNSVRARTGNVSAGTSIFAMVVLEKELKGYYPQIDLVTTPSGEPVAMVHGNNCTSDLNAWIGLFEEALREFGVTPSAEKLYGTLFRTALDGEADCGGLMSYNYFSGESLTDFPEGRPLFLRKAEDTMSLANFMRTHLYTSMGALKSGMDLLMKKERVALERMNAHGGLFKTPEVAQRFLAAALETPVYVMETAGEGGAWGCALLASYRMNRQPDETLETFLAGTVFRDTKSFGVRPEPADVEGFTRFMERYYACLPVERAAVESL